ncbi:MAG: hypothetical protein JWN08_3290, partial [Frankiales bacterium]|nr:hypothetical protein [Frankiales bacterium]
MTDDVPVLTGVERLLTAALATLLAAGATGAVALPP